MIFYYGGCWGACTQLSKSDYRFVAEALVGHDSVVVVPDYRRYPEVLFPTLMDDARQVLEWVGTHIDEFGGDPEQLFLMGHSSGAHMAAMLSLNEACLTESTYQSLKGFIGLAGPYDFLPLTKPYQQKLFAPRDSYAQSQPINFVTGNELPMLLLYGAADETVKPKNITNLAAKVRALDGRVETHVYAGLNHRGLLAALSIPLRGDTQVYHDIQVFIHAH